MQQNWLDANTGPYADLMRYNLNQSEPLKLDAVDVRWINGNNGKPEALTRAVGTISQDSGRQLAQLMGGTLVQSPFDIYGSSQKDQYIRMPNGQMVEASMLASQLNAARATSDPFSATQAVLDLYRSENQSFDLNTSRNAIDLMGKGILSRGLPPTQAT
jgi:hypothetical protein